MGLQTGRVQANLTASAKATGGPPKPRRRRKVGPSMAYSASHRNRIDDRVRDDGLRRHGLPSHDHEHRYFTIFRV
jgi:hypothetical protein